MILRLRRLRPGGLWETVKAAGRKGDDRRVAEDVDQSGRTRQLPLLTHRRGLSDVAVVPLELPLDCPVGTADRRRHLSVSQTL